MTDMSLVSVVWLKYFLLTILAPFFMQNSLARQLNTFSTLYNSSVNVAGYLATCCKRWQAITQNCYSVFEIDYLVIW